MKISEDDVRPQMGRSALNHAAHMMRITIDNLYPHEECDTLGKKQRRFVLMEAALIAYAYSRGWELSTGDAWGEEGDGRHKKGSFHYKRLARDFNLFIDGEYQTSTEAHEPLGKFWERMNGTWGGRFDDGNHYSYTE